MEEEIKEIKLEQIAVVQQGSSGFMVFGLDRNGDVWSTDDYSSGWYRLNMEPEKEDRE